MTWVALNPLLFGVRCHRCGASVPASHPDREDAVRAWNRRSGLATLGGKATRGKSSWKKRRACRRNLGIARRRKKLKAVKTQIDTAASRLKVLREVELASLEEASARDRAELEALAHHPVLRKDPVLTGMLARLTHGGQGRGPEQPDSLQLSWQFRSILPE